MKLYIEQMKGAMETWVKQKGGEPRLGDSNMALYRTLKLVIHGMEMCQKLESTEQGNEDNQIQTRLRRIKGALERDLEREFQHLQDRLFDDMTEVAEMTVEHFVPESTCECAVEELQERIRMDPDLLLDDEMIEVKKFVLGMMKAQKDAPETATDRLNPEIMSLD